ncbi:hypothetical protein ACH4S8_18075 [Streptomyces sp. NPDC021080]|uniref:hypothetical protein n=1 Tax=Streptomyces sp. NPDC021080 TaxID=3365110 RepID=UPI0037A9DF3B
MTVVAVASAVLGGYHVPLPTVRDGVSAGVPFRRELPMISGVFLAAVRTSSLAVFEDVAGPAYFRMRTNLTLATVAAACLLSFAAEGGAAGTSLGIVFVRSMLIWYGLALLSERVLGAGLAWIFPVASVFPLVWLSEGDWWDWTAAPASDLTSWCLAGACLTLGVVMTAVTRRRLRSVLAIFDKS